MSRDFSIEILGPAAGRGVMAALAALVNDVYAATEKGLWADGAARTSAEDIAGLADAGEIAVATRGGSPIGCVRVRRLEEGVSEFGLLAADRRHQGTGVGRELVRFAEDRGRETGCGTMQLELLVPREWTHPSKEFLHHWYTRLGYAVVDSAPVAELEPGLAPFLATPCEFAIYRKALG